MSRRFYEDMKPQMITYKKDILRITENGTRIRNGIIYEYEHILPANLWRYNLWEDIRESAPEYFRKEKIKWHDHRDNLLSAQIFCVNIFFPLRNNLNILEGFLKQFCPSLTEVTNVDFEYIGNKNYFCETGGRGYSRTSSDVAIIWKNNQRKNNILLVEFKFTESNFGGCGKSDNPKPERCNNGNRVLYSNKKECYRSEVKRPYWDMILSDDSPLIKKTLLSTQCCPFKYDFYQLMRNQLLAKCLMDDKELDYSNAEFAICYDDRNDDLLTTKYPILNDSNIISSWKSFLKNPDTFKYFTTQNLLKYIDNNCILPNELSKWREYLRERYYLL